MNGTNSTTNPTIYHRTHNWWKSRTKMEKEQLVLLIFISLLLLGFLLYVIIINAIIPNTCRTQTCILEASRIVKNIDTTIQPCDDFFKFACGRFIRESHGDIAAAAIKQQQDQVARQLAEIIKEPVQDSDTFWIKNQKEFYKACMNERRVEEESLDVLNTMLEEIHGWPVVMTFRWRDALFDWTEIVYKFVRKGYSHSMMLNIWVVEDPAKNNRHIVNVKEPSVSAIVEEHKYLYKQFMVDVAVQFGADRGRAEIEMQRVLLFMEQLNMVCDQNNIDSGDETNLTSVMENRYTVQNFSEQNKEFGWLEYINGILDPVAKVSDDDYVIFPTKDFVKTFFNLIERTEKRILANYIIWSLIEESIPYLTKELKELQATYKWRTGQTLSNGDRHKFCKTEIDKSYYPRPYEIQYARKYLPEKTHNQVKNLVTSVKSELIKTLQQTTWMDHASKIRVTEKANAIVEIIGAPRDYFNDAVLEQVPRNISEPVHNGSFFEMVLNHRKLLSDAGFFRLHMSVNSTKLDEFFATPHVDAGFSVLDNVIILPVGILQGIFYNPKRPMYLNYGSLGSIIGHELVHGFGEAASKYGKDSQGTGMWTTETEDAFKEKVECVIEEANNFYTVGMKSKINGTLTLEENIADYVGIQVSYEAYKKWRADNGEEPRLIGLEYTPSQLFWISAVSHECFNAKEDALNLHAPNSFRATAPLRNNPNFVKDFKCPQGAKMNPVNKCQIF